MWCSGPLYTMPELRHRDSGNLEVFLWLFYQPLLKVEEALFATNDDIRVKDYRHLSPGLASRFLAAVSSLFHVLASSEVISNFSIASANSRPVQVPSFSGTSLATGLPFLSNTNVAFW